MKSCTQYFEDLDQLVFVVGSGRSGSTLLKHLLDRHPEVAVVPEFQFFKQVYDKRGRYNTQEAFLRYAGDRLTDIIVSGEYGQDRVSIKKEELQEEIGSAENICDLLAKISRAVASKEDFSVLVHKTPSDIFFLPLLFELFPDAKVIHVVRDGREMVASARRRGWGKDVFIPVAQWQEALRAFDSFQANNPQYGTQLIEVTYEHIVSRHQEVIQEIFSFIGAGDIPEHVFELDDFDYSNTSFEEEEKSGLYHSKHFEEFFTPREQRKITALLSRDLKERGYTVETTGWYPLTRARLWLRRMKFRFFIWIKEVGYGHYYNKMRRLVR